MHTNRVSMLFAALLVGVLVSLQWPNSIPRRESTPDQIMQTIRALELEQAELKRTVGVLRQELDTRQQEIGTGTGLLEDLQSELIAQKLRAGLIDSKGPGLRIVLDDSDSASIGNANDRLVHDYDLRDVVNLLWMAGAEAVAVNGERIVNSTSIYCVGSTVLVNDTRLSPPYEISAIGDPRRLLDHIENPGYLNGLKARRARVGVQLEVFEVGSMVISAFQGSLPLEYAKPGS
jgi:uncharacterized protein YlxW (UPF0749 family)